MGESVIDLPQYINPVKAAQAQEKISAKVVLSKLGRLKDRVLNLDNDVAVNMVFYKDMDNYTVIDIKLNAELSLTCQRCMQPMEFAFASEGLLSPVTSDQAAKQLPGQYDPVIVVDNKIDLWELVEEEILLNLPLMLMHENTKNCQK